MLLTLLACASPQEARIQVAAASSLRDAFRDLKDHYQHDVSAVPVELNFAGSQVLRLQIEHGAEVDLFASANAEHVQQLIATKHLQTAQPFASNALVVIVPLDNPAGILHFEDLPKATHLVVGAPTAPIGVYAEQILTKAEAEFNTSFVTNIVSRESNARLIRAKVELGVADAAIVYKTDVNDRVKAVPIPEPLNVEATYTVGFDHPSPFTTYLLSEAGQDVLRQHGFGTP